MSGVNTNMKDWGSGLEKSTEDLHGAVSDWGVNESIDILPHVERISQVGLVSQFTKQTSLDLDKIWSKNQAYKDVMA